jgi:hypothetical protein
MESMFRHKNGEKSFGQPPPETPAEDARQNHLQSGLCGSGSQTPKTTPESHQIMNPMGKTSPSP